MKKLTGLSFAAVALLAAAPAVFAQSGNQTVVMSVGNERYVGGPDVSVNQAVSGDLTVAGGTVTVNAAVAGSLQAAGGTVMLGNTVQGNVRVAGGTVIITKNIKGNLVVAGGNVRVQTGVVIGGSVLALAGETTIDGTVTGDIKSRGGILRIHNTVRGNADIQGDSMVLNGRILGNAIIAARTIEMGTSASIGKDLHYWQAAGERDFGTVVKGKTIYDPAFAMEDKENKGMALGILGALLAAITIYSVLSGALVIGLFMFISRTFFKESAKLLKTKPGSSFLTGLLYFVLTPIAVVLLLITIIGIPVAVAVALLFVISLLFAKALSAMVFARYLEMKYKKKWSNVTVFFVSLGIFLLLKLIGIVPVVGWIVTCVAVLMGYGAVLGVKYEKYKKIM